MNINTAMIKQLRNQTMCGILDCKIALSKADGDIEKAIMFLREQGLIAYDNRSNNEMTEGIVYSYSYNGSLGVIVEVNTETDFLSKSEDFKKFVNNTIVTAILYGFSDDLEKFLDEDLSHVQMTTLREELMYYSAKVKENIMIKRYSKLIVPQAGVYNYNHGEKIAVLVAIKSPAYVKKIDELGHNICLQIASMNPQFVSRGDIPEEIINKEKKFLRNKAVLEGKAEKVIEKIITGGLEKFYKTVCLLDQEYIKDSGLTIKEYIDKVSKDTGEEIDVKEFIRYSK